MLLEKLFVGKGMLLKKLFVGEGMLLKKLFVGEGPFCKRASSPTPPPPKTFIPGSICYKIIF